MSAGPDHRPLPPSGVRVRVLRDVIEVACPAIFSRSAAGQISHFLRETAAIPRVEAVEVDLDAGVALIRFQPGRVDARRLVGELAANLRRPSSTPGLGDLSPAVVESLSRDGKIQVQRVADVVTDLELLHDIHGRLRVRHPHLKGDPVLAREVEGELRPLNGVTAVEARTRTGSVLVYYTPAVLTKPDLLRALGRAIHKTGRRAATPVTVAALVPHSVSLGAATIAEFAAPALLPAAGAVFVAANWRSLVNGSKELLTLRPRLDGLGTAITTLTVINGSFFAASAMLWLINFWRLKHEWARSAARDRLLEDLAVPVDEPQAESLPAQLGDGRRKGKPGDIVRLTSGDRITADGEVCGGAAAVDERCLTGRDAIVRRAVGDRVLAGATVLDGRIVVRRTATGSETRASVLGREIEGALQASRHPKAYTVRSERAAATMVVPAFALAGAGFALGGVGTALAVLRPDYASGIGVADSFERIRVVGTHMQDGVLVRRPEALARLRSVRSVLISSATLPHSCSVVHRVESQSLWTAEALLGLAVRTGRYFGNEVAEAVRAEDRGVVPIAVPVEFDDGVTFWDGQRLIRIEHARGAPGYHTLTVTTNAGTAGRIDIRPAAEPAAALVTAFKRNRVAVGFVGGDRKQLLRAGADFVIPPVRDDELGDQIEEWGEAGRRIVFVGDVRSYPRAAGAAEVSVSTAGLDHPTAGDVVLLSGTCDSAPALWGAARRGRLRRAMAFGMTWGPNAAGVAAGFVFGLPLITVALSNAGTLAAYTWGQRNTRLPASTAAIWRPGAGPSRNLFKSSDVRAPPIESGDGETVGVDQPETQGKAPDAGAEDAHPNTVLQNA